MAPLVAVYSTGGTIASVPGAAPGAVPSLSAEELLAAVPGLDGVAELRATSFSQVPSPDLRLAHLGGLIEAARAEVSGGASGVVITQGTDTLEESAFVLDLLWSRPEPLVLTGAMRNPSLAGADGPANLLAAVRVAASEQARGLGCVVVFADEIHPARYVRKTHTTSVATFGSWVGGPLGWVIEDRVRIAARPVRRAVGPLPAPAVLSMAPVALVRAALEDDGRMLSAVRQLGYRGLVVEATGGGHVPGWWAEPLGLLASEMPVVLASRTGAGEVLRSTYGFPGSESDLLKRGLVPAGGLDGLKARLLLGLLLAAAARRERIRAAFEAFG